MKIRDPQLIETFHKIRAKNADLTNPEVKKGRYIGFQRAGKNIDLPTALRSLDAGNRRLSLRVFEWEKAAKAPSFLALMFGGSIPMLNGVMLGTLRLLTTDEVRKGVDLDTSLALAELL